MIIAVAGKKYSGKDTVMDLFLSKVSGFDKVLTSPIVMGEYAEKMGLTIQQILDDKELHREGLQAIGDGEATRIMAKAIALADPDKKWFINSVRRKEEIAWLDRDDTIYLLVDAPHKLREERAGCKLVGEKHATETEAVEILQDHKNCFHVCNDGDIEKLEKRLLEIIQILKLG